MRGNDKLLFIIAVFLFIIILILLPPWAMNIFIIVLFVLFFIGLFFLLLIPMLSDTDYGILPLISFFLMIFLLGSLIAFFSDHFSSEKTPIENAISYFLFLSSTFGD